MDLFIAFHWKCGSKESVVPENTQKLLVLQDRNALVDRLQSEIKRLPAEVQKLNKLIEEEQQVVSDKKNEVQALEVERSQIELEVGVAEEQIAKYKNQQIQVKKNDEYKALTQQIEQTEESVSNLETKELELMEAIDEKNAELVKVSEEVSKRVNYQEGLIEECNQKLSNLESQLDGAKKSCEEQVSSMEPDSVKIFEQLKNQVKRPPYIVGITNQNCGGCHMRVSNDSLKKAKMGMLARCDQCARIVYFESQS